MKILPVALSISASAHAVAVTVALARESAPHPPPPIASSSMPAIEIVSVSPTADPVDVALLDDAELSSMAAIDPGTTAATPRRHTRTPRRAIAATSGDEPATALLPRPHAPANPLFAMRGPRPLDLRGAIDRVTGGYDALDHAPAGTRAHVDPRPSGRLQPDGGGRHRSDEKVFTADVAPDGTVTFRDTRNVRITSPLSLGFDATDALMRSHGMDPYASRKLRYLDDTRDERVAIGKRYRAQQLARSPQLMRNNLTALWASTADLAARKRGLFELWDECTETGDATAIAGGRAARAMVIGWIRARLPAGTASAYTPDELARFDRARKSKARFAPYAREPRGEHVPSGAR